MAAIWGEGTISAKKVVITPYILPQNLCWLLESHLLPTRIFPATQMLKALAVQRKAEAIRGLSGNTTDKL